jgi:hypothetical protein
MTPEQKQELIRLLETGEEISPEWARVLFPPESRTPLLSGALDCRLFEYKWLKKR